MTTYEVPDTSLNKLRGKTILLTGCASGIGRETAKIAFENGANLALGDWNEEAGNSLIRELGGNERLLFRKVDVSQWDDIFDLFQTAWKHFGIIHAVLSNAGINTENFLEDEIDPQSGRLKAPSTKSIDVNLIAHIYTVKCAVHYFEKWPETRCQIVLTGSAASFLDTPPLYLYCAAKAGVLGLMRGLRTQLTRKNVTINMIAPWMTVTPMLLPEVLEIWGELPANQPSGVARALLLPVMEDHINGKAFFVAGHKIFDFEDSLQETQHLWMGKRLSEDVAEGQRRLIL